MKLYGREKIGTGFMIVHQLFKRPATYIYRLIRLMEIAKTCIRTKAKCPPTTGLAMKPSASPLGVSYQSLSGTWLSPSDAHFLTELMKRSRVAVSVTIPEVHISQSAEEN